MRTLILIIVTATVSISLAYSSKTIHKEALKSGKSIDNKVGLPTENTSTESNISAETTFKEFKKKIKEIED